MFNPLWFNVFYKSNSFKGMYREMEGIAKVHLGMDELPFPLSAIENPPGNKSCPDIVALLLRCSRIQMVVPLAVA